MILNLKKKLSLKKNNNSKKSRNCDNLIQKSSYIDNRQQNSASIEGSLSCSYAAAGVQATVRELNRSLDSTNSSSKNSVHSSALNYPSSPFESFKSNLKKPFKNKSKSSSKTPTTDFHKSYTHSEPTKLTKTASTSNNDTSRTYSLENSCIESSEDWSESISQPFYRNSWQISPDLLSNTFSASSGHFNSPELSLNNTRLIQGPASQLSLNKSNSSNHRLSSFFSPVNHSSPSGHLNSYPAIQVNSTVNQQIQSTNYNQPGNLSTSFDGTLKNTFRSLSPNRSSVMDASNVTVRHQNTNVNGNGYHSNNGSSGIANLRPVSQLINSSDIRNIEKFNLSSSFLDDERLRLHSQTNKSISPLLKENESQTHHSTPSHAHQSPTCYEDSQVSPLNSLMTNSCTLGSFGPTSNSSPPFIDAGPTPSTRNVAGTVIHEENEDGIDDAVTSSTGIDLDPSLAAYVAQVSTRTGANPKEIVAGIAEVRRRPVETRNRLRRLGNISTNSGINQQHLMNGYDPMSTSQTSQNSTTSAGDSNGINKRLSLPTNINIPAHLWHKADHFFEDPMSRRERRMSLNEIGFGKVESYRKLEMLGKGTYATVFRGRSLLTDTIVALKEIRLEHEEGAPCTAIREVSLLRGLKHANVVILHDIIYTEKMFTLVFEYLEKDLKQYIEDCRGILHEDNVQLFLYQLLRGLEFCHKRQILHRDLKPQNLLINERGDLKLADFGLARAKSIPIKTYSNDVVTLWYRPPDVLLGCTEYSTPIDLWGVGCIFYEMATGWPLFPGSTVDEELKIIFKHLGTPNEKNWPGVSSHPEIRKINSFGYYPGCSNGLVHLAPRLNRKGHSLLMQFLTFQGKNRINTANALKHTYFTTSKLPCDKISKLPDQTSIFEIPDIQLSRNPLCGPVYQMNQNRITRSNHHHLPHGSVANNNNNTSNGTSFFKPNDTSRFFSANNHVANSNGNGKSSGKLVFQNQVHSKGSNMLYQQNTKTANSSKHLAQPLYLNKQTANANTNRHSTHIMVNPELYHHQTSKATNGDVVPPIPPHHQKSHQNPALVSSFHAAQNQMASSNNPIHAPYKYHRPLSNFLEGMPSSILEFPYHQQGGNEAGGPPGSAFYHPSQNNRPVIQPR